MARVCIEGGSEYAGPGEKKMFELLKENLPDSFMLIKNITNFLISFGNAQAMPRHMHA